MNVVWLPRYSEVAASSRLRVYAMHKEFTNLGVSSIIADRESIRSMEGDVLIIQKITDLGILQEVLDRKRFKIIAYDYDDVDIFPTLYQIKDKVDFFITDTAGHRMQNLQAHFEIIPDCVDYGLVSPLPDSQGQGAVWFGCYANYPAAEWMIAILKDAGIRTHVITDPGELLHLGPIVWNPLTFVTDLRKYGISIFSHAVGDRNKSHNKMITSIMAGVPCIVSNTPAYTAVAHEIGSPWSAVSNKDSLLNAWGLLCGEERIGYLKRAQAFVKETFTSPVVAGRYISMLTDWINR